MKPILFNTGMVRAILEGRKTVMRRVVKPQPVECPALKMCNDDIWRIEWWNVNEFHSKRVPYCIGDILYVQETFHQTPNGQYWYKADNLCKGCTEIGFCMPKGVAYHKTCEICEYYDGYENIKWCPSIHMPREAARIFLQVTDVRVERLQDITEEQAVSEGCAAGAITVTGGPWGVEDDPEEWTAIEAFSELWNRTIKPADRALYGWDASPWVWVIAFERISKEEAQS